MKIAGHEVSLPTQEEVLAFGLNIASGVAPILAMFVAFSAVTPDQQHLVTSSINQIFVGLGEVVKGIRDAWVGVLGLGFLVPLVAGWWARLRSRPSQQVKNVQAAVATGAVKDVAIIPTGPSAPISAAAGDLAKAHVITKGAI